MAKNEMNNGDLINLIDNYPGGMFLADLKGNIFALNKNLAFVFNEKRENLIGKSAYEFLEKLSGKLRGEQLHEVVKTKKPVTFIDCERGKWWRTTFIPVSEDNGKIELISIYFNEITNEMDKQNEKLLSQEFFYFSLLEH